MSGESAGLFRTSAAFNNATSDQRIANSSTCEPAQTECFGFTTDKLYSSTFQATVSDNTSHALLDMIARPENPDGADAGSPRRSANCARRVIRPKNTNFGTDENNRVSGGKYDLIVLATFFTRFSDTRASANSTVGPKPSASKFFRQTSLRLSLADMASQQHSKNRHPHHVPS